MKRALAIAFALIVLAQTAGTAKSGGAPEVVAAVNAAHLVVDSDCNFYWRTPDGHALIASGPTGRPASLEYREISGEYWLVMANGDWYSIAFVSAPTPPGLTLTFTPAGNVFGSVVSTTPATWSQMKTRSR